MGAWNPWRTLRELVDVEFDTAPLPRGVSGLLAVYPDARVVIVDDQLTQVERNAALAHELVHLERGIPCRAHDRRWRHLAAREEQAVEDEVARRLVPLDALKDYVVRRESVCERVEPWQVAEDWRVPERVAIRAMQLLYDDINSQIVARLPSGTP